MTGAGDGNIADMALFSGANTELKKCGTTQLVEACTADAGDGVTMKRTQMTSVTTKGIKAMLRTAARANRRPNIRIASATHSSPNLRA